MKRQRSRRVIEVRPQAVQLRLAPGDVIRCAAFATGVRWHHDLTGPIQVAWRTNVNPDYYVRCGQATLANDPLRATAPFLVHAISLVESDGPDDVAPGEHRLAREVVCVRLGDDFSFDRAAERIRFALDEPMSMARPDEATIEILGYAALPISWKERVG